METPEQMARLDIPGLEDQRDAQDLANAINSLSGVAHVMVEDNGKSLSVSFDPRYVDRDMIEDVVRGAGYNAME